MKKRRSGGGGASDPSAIGHHGHAMQIKDFVDAIRKDRAPAIDGHEGRRSVEIIQGIYKAAQTGRRLNYRSKGSRNTVSEGGRRKGEGGQSIALRPPSPFRPPPWRIQGDSS